MIVTFAILKVLYIMGDLRFSILNSKEFQLTFKTTLFIRDHVEQKQLKQFVVLSF